MCYGSLFYYGYNEYSYDAILYHISQGIPNYLQLWSPCVKLANSEHSPFQRLKY